MKEYIDKVYTKMCNEIEDGLAMQGLENQIDCLEGTEKYDFNAEFETYEENTGESLPIGIKPLLVNMLRNFCKELLKNKREQL